MEIKANYVVPYEATPPGSILTGEMEYKGISLEEMCEKANIDVNFLKELIRGEHPITEELAHKFEAVVGIEARLWLRMQATYEYDLWAIAERERTKKAHKPSLFKRMTKSVAAAML